MGRTVDDKIVNISIDFKKFGDGVKKVTQDADKLNKSLKFPNAGKGLEDISKAAKNVDLTKVISGIDGISGKLNALRLIAINTFSNLVSAGIRAGARFAKSFTLGPIIAGFQEYSTNLTAIQTILANTKASGATLKDVNAALLELNKYSDKTIYNFSEMAKNIGTFTAAGVDLDTSVQSIKGIANLAALSGSSAEQASTAMYQLSQAIASGRVSLQDWRSVVNAGIGGTVFQRALAQTAVKMGTIKDSAVKLSGPMKNVTIAGEPFFKSIAATSGKPSWLTSDVLTKTLTQFTGDLTDAQLAAQGFNKEQIRMIQQTAKSASLAATQVKTITQVLDVAKETAGSGWAQSFQILFGNFGEAKTLFTAVSNAVNGFINANAAARNKVLGDWKALGGRTILIKAIKEAFQDLGAILKPIKQAFRDIFPKKSASDLLAITKRFKELADRMRPSAETADNIRHTFHGLFAALDIGRQIVSGILSMFKSLFVTLGAGSGGFLNFTAGVGDFIVKLDEAMKKGNAFHGFFVKMGAVLGAPLKALLRLKDAIAGLFQGFSSAGISTGVSGLKHALTPLQKLLELIAKAWHTMLDAAHGSLDMLQPLIDQIVIQFQKMGPAIADAIKNMNVEAILQVIRTALLGGIFLLFRNFFRTGGKLFHLQSRVTIFSLMNYVNWTSEQFRRFLSTYFTPKSTVRLVFTTDEIDDPVEIYGIVEGMSNNPFTDVLEFQVSIICPDPYFKSTVAQSVSFLTNNDTETLDIVDIDNPGDLAVGFFIRVQRLATDSFDFVQMQMGLPVFSHFRIDDMPIDASKSLEVSSERLNKFVHEVVLADATFANVFTRVDRTSEFLVLEPGRNYFTIFTDTGDQDWAITWYPRYDGL